MTLTIWNNAQTGEVSLHQLSDMPSDGTAVEQIAHLATLSAYAGFSCVSDDYAGPVPDADPALWRWDGTQIIAIVPVPQVISPRQCRLLLLQQGQLAAVEAMIAQQDEATRITWEYAIEFRRDDPLLNTLATSMGWTAEQLDAFFVEASQL